MSIFSKLNARLKSNNDTGFSSATEGVGGRFINKDGSFNVTKEGASVIERVSLYQNMLTMPLGKFLLVILFFFIGINVIFTLAFFFMTTDQLTGMIFTSPQDHFKELFFFSAQTLTTVGYGRINPVGTLASSVASLEALCGFLGFAVITGLLYGKFSRPRAYLKFSENALVAPYMDKTGLMFRFMSYKENHTLTDVEVKVTFGITGNEQNKEVFKFYTLPLERSKIDSLVMNWTVVHPIDEESPLFGLTHEELQNSDAEIYVLVRGFDDIFSNTVLQRTSYRFKEEVIFNAKFQKMFRESPDGNTTIMELNKLNDFHRLDKQA